MRKLLPETVAVVTSARSLLASSAFVALGSLALMPVSVPSGTALATVSLALNGLGLFQEARKGKVSRAGADRAT